MHSYWPQSGFCRKSFTCNSCNFLRGVIHYLQYQGSCQFVISNKCVCCWNWEWVRRHTCHSVSYSILVEPLFHLFSHSCTDISIEWSENCCRGIETFQCIYVHDMGCKGLFHLRHDSIGCILYLGDSANTAIYKIHRRNFWDFCWCLQIC